jgi:hypothetical protein
MRPNPDGRHVTAAGGVTRPRQSQPGVFLDFSRNRCELIRMHHQPHYSLFHLGDLNRNLRAFCTKRADLQAVSER